MVTSLFWHSIAPKSLQDELLNVRSLVHKLLDWPLIHNVIVPATIYFEALEASVLWVLRYGLGDLIQQLVYGFRGACSEELKPNVTGRLVLELFKALFLELLDTPLFPDHLDVLAVEIYLTVVHNELRSIRGLRRLIRELHDVDIVDAESEAVIVRIEAYGELPVKLIVLEYHRV